MSWSATNISPITNSIRNLGLGAANLALKKAQIDRQLGKDIYESRLTDAKTQKAQAEADKEKFTLQGMHDLWDAKQLEALSPRERTGIAVNMMAPRNVYGDAVDAETNRDYRHTLGANNTRLTNAQSAYHYAHAAGENRRSAAAAALDAARRDYVLSNITNRSAKNEADIALQQAKAGTEYSKQDLNRAKVGTEGYTQQEILGRTKNAEQKANSDAAIAKAREEVYRATAGLRNAQAAAKGGSTGAAAAALKNGVAPDLGPLADLDLEITGKEIPPSELHAYFTTTDSVGFKHVDSEAETAAIKRFTDLHLPMTRGNLRKYLANPGLFQQTAEDAVSGIQVPRDVPNDGLPPTPAPAAEPTTEPTPAPATAPAASAEEAVSFLNSLDQPTQNAVKDIVARFRSGSLTEQQAKAELSKLGIN